MITVLLTLAASRAVAAPYQLDAEHSLFAVITQRAGLAAFLLRRHFIVASPAAVAIDYDVHKLGNTHFVLQARTTDLTIDDPAAQEAWYPRLHALHILESPMASLASKQLTELRELMLSREQLDARRFPEIKVELRYLKEDAGRFENIVVTHHANIAVTIRDRTILRQVGVNLAQLNDKTLSVEAIGRFRLSEFGITPYETALGAARVDDDFLAVVILSAKPVR